MVKEKFAQPLKSLKIYEHDCSFAGKSFDALVSFSSALSTRTYLLLKSSYGLSWPYMTEVHSELSQTSNMELFATCQLQVLNVVYVPTCQKRASLSFLHAIVPINVPTCQRRAKFSIWRAKVPRRANILTWRANLPKVVPFFNFTCQKVCQFFDYFSKELYL